MSLITNKGEKMKLAKILAISIILASSCAHAQMTVNSDGSSSYSYDNGMTINSDGTSSYSYDNGVTINSDGSSSYTYK